jgi:hypothetical protein
MRRFLLLLLTSLALTGCGGGTHESKSAVSPAVGNEIMAQLHRDTLVGIKRATHGRVNLSREAVSVGCIRRDDTKLLCTVKGLGKPYFVWRWLVTIDPQTGAFHTRTLSRRLPRAS